MNEPCDFVKLVLQRMDTNPDEFELYGRWNTLCIALEHYAGAANNTLPMNDRNVLWAYDQFEIDLMLAKYREVYRDREYKAMLKNLLVGAEPKAEGALIRSSLGQQQYANNTVRTGLMTNLGLQQAATAQLNSSFEDAFRNAAKSSGSSS